MLKALSKPFRHFFNVRFEAINGEIKLVQARIDSLHADLEESSPAAGSAGATSDSLAAVTTVIDARHGDLLAVASLLGRAVDTAVDGVDVLLDRTDPGSDRFIGDALTPIVVKEEGTAEPFDPAVRGTVAALGADDAAIANYSASHLGWASQAGYWFNPPISVAHAEGGVRIGDVNERIAEIPYVFAALSRLPMGSRILDVGSTESTVAVSLASLGYQVTALEIRGPIPSSTATYGCTWASLRSSRTKRPMTRSFCYRASSTSASVPINCQKPTRRTASRCGASGSCCDPAVCWCSPLPSVRRPRPTWNALTVRRISTNS